MIVRTIALLLAPLLTAQAAAAPPGGKLSRNDAVLVIETPAAPGPESNRLPAPAVAFELGGGVFWFPVAGAEKYIIYQNGEKIAETASDTTSYSAFAEHSLLVEAAEEGDEVWYEVSAVVNGEESPKGSTGRQIFYHVTWSRDSFRTDPVVDRLATYYNTEGGWTFPPTMPTGPCHSRAECETPEYFGLYGAFQGEELQLRAPDIGAAAAYARGHTGKGVTFFHAEHMVIGHPEFAGQLEYALYDDGVLRESNPAELAATRYYSLTSPESINRKDEFKDFYHGSPTAGLLVAAKDGYGMHGVAFDAKLLVVGGGSRTQRATALPSILPQAADIASFSLYGTPEYSDNNWPAINWDERVKAGHVQVVSSGNDGQIPSARPSGFEASRLQQVQAGKPVWRGAAEPKNIRECRNLLLNRQIHECPGPRVPAEINPPGEINLLWVSGVQPFVSDGHLSRTYYRLGEPYQVRADRSSSGCLGAEDFRTGESTCISAPYTYVSVLPGYRRDYEGFSGTSASAPVAAGGVGLILSAFRHQTAAQAAWRMTRTATPLCGTYNEPVNGDACKAPNPGYQYEDADGVMQTHTANDGFLPPDCKSWENCPIHGWPNDVYGWGLMNLDEATKPQGTPEQMALAAADGRARYALPDSAIVSTPAFANALLARDDLTFAYFDDYGALFPGLPFAAVRADNGEALRQSLGLLADGVIADDDQTIIPAPPGRQLSWQAAPGDARLHYRDLTFRYQTDACDAAAAETIASSFNLAGAQSSSAGCRPRREVRSFAAMLDDFAPTTAAGELALTPRREYALSAKWQTAINPNNNIALFYERQTDSHLRAAAQWQIQAGDNLRIALEGGHLQEDDTLLGAEFNGALGVKDGASTAYARAALHIQDGEWDAYASYVKARTNAEPKAGGVIAEMSRLYADGYALGASRGGIIGGDDALRATIRRPLSIKQGEMTLRYIGGFVDDVEARGQDALRVNEHSVNLSGDPLTIYALSYERALGWGKTAIALEHLQNSPGEKYAGDETVLSAGFNWDF